MNFLGFWPNAFIISKKIRLPLFELIKDEVVLKVRYKETLSILTQINTISNMK
jgi:hypothetical protein